MRSYNSNVKVVENYIIVLGTMMQEFSCWDFYIEDVIAFNIKMQEEGLLT